MNRYDMDVYGSVKVGERGQVVIPSGAREKLGIRPGDFLLVVSTPQRDGIAMIRVEAVKNMIRKISLGLTEADTGRKRTASRKRKR